MSPDSSTRGCWSYSEHRADVVCAKSNCMWRLAKLSTPQSACWGHRRARVGSMRVQIAGGSCLSDPTARQSAPAPRNFLMSPHFSQIFRSCSLHCPNNGACLSTAHYLLHSGSPLWVQQIARFGRYQPFRLLRLHTHSQQLRCACSSASRVSSATANLASYRTVNSSARLGHHPARHPRKSTPQNRDDKQDQDDHPFQPKPALPYLFLRHLSQGRSATIERKTPPCR